LATRLRQTAATHEGIWRIVMIKGSLSEYPNIRHASRVPKISPKYFFSESVEYAIYVDQKLIFMQHPAVLMKIVQAPFLEMDNFTSDSRTSHSRSSTSQTALMAVRHPKSKSVYQEYNAVKKALKSGRSDISMAPAKMDSQIKIYENLSKRTPLASGGSGGGNEMDLQYGNLLDGAFLFHNLQSPQAHFFRCAWYLEYVLRSDRDQLAFPFVLSRARRTLGGVAQDTRCDDCLVFSGASNGQGGGGTGAHVRLLKSKMWHWYFNRNIAKLQRDK
jgi:hypothetical protein